MVVDPTSNIKTKQISNVSDELKEELQNETPITNTSYKPKVKIISEKTTSPLDVITVSNNTTTKSSSVKEEQTTTEPVKEVIRPTVLKRTSTSLKPNIENIALDNLKVMINRYLTLNKGILDTNEKRTKASDLMKNIVNSVIVTPTNSMVNEFFNFVKNNRTRALAPELVFQGTKKFKKDTIHKMQVLYGYVYNVTSPNFSKKPNLTIVRQILGNALTDKLITRSQKK